MNCHPCNHATEQEFTIIKKKYFFNAKSLGDNRFENFPWKKNGAVRFF